MLCPLSYTPQSIELEHSLKPFIPDFIPAVGDIDAFLKVQTHTGLQTGSLLVVFFYSQKLKTVSSHFVLSEFTLTT